MLLFPLLLITPTIILAQSPTPTSISVIHTLIPPYGPGPAIYHASIAGVQPFGTVYHITCSPPPASSLQTPTLQWDPCLTRYFGTESQTFTQVSTGWFVARDLQSSTATHKSALNKAHTNCNIQPQASPRLGVNDVGLLSCSAYSYDGAGRGTQTEGDGYAKFGLRRQDVTVTGGWESLEGPVVTTESTLAVGSFTDIGATATKGAPVTTVTLHKVGGDAATISGQGMAGWTAVLVAFATAFVL
ncbi:uncharacterized protein BDR25DRAFT_340056 [Lindgomyces ingoldianus]|uniref:Uncharacterized protein n=1 Tax=Lindgomyces ingoldianus TaxID=673940 RepID=A0ACB6R8X3_9PLEO|nr:uncharacterized protein BDR25DRAFT_340056 [Lindgomyces ingoldianus]KAF2475195.1 hypothetical protein BDR25DRAFT_340056 [Lindgomyces ingoldianus]